MKKSELYLLFITLFIGLSILLVALFKYIKPSNTFSIENETNNINVNKKVIENSWIDRISKKNQDFIYPVTIYKLKL
jgi:hypothetical protein